MQELVNTIISLLTNQPSFLHFSGFVIGPMVIVIAYMAHSLKTIPNTALDKKIIVLTGVVGFMIWTISLMHYAS
jgi:hypothetical protein